MIMERQSQHTENKPRARTDEKHASSGMIKNAHEKNSNSKKNDKLDDNNNKAVAKSK
jgi:hypothetical protein